MSKQVEVLRLALRLEGEDGCDWNAYIAEPDTMEGAVLVATVKRVFLDGHDDLRIKFVAIFQELTKRFVQSTLDDDEAIVSMEIRHPKAN